MRSREFQAAERAVAAFEHAGGTFVISPGRIDLYAEDLHSDDFRSALAKVEKRKKLLQEFLRLTRGGGNALAELWQADAALRGEYGNLETLEAASDLFASSLLENLHEGEAK